jgi:hypothetical protein
LSAARALRSAELDSRREVGLIVRDLDVVRKLIETFESDWTVTGARKAVARAGEDVLNDKDVKDTMKKVVKKAVKEAVREAVQDAQDAQEVKEGKDAKEAKSR